MNLTHLGDAFDFWKGGVIGALAGLGHLQDVHVLPMITDWPIRERWQDGHFALYAALLGVARERVLRQDVEFTTETRADYFRIDPHLGDVFVDPDTGIEPTTRGGTEHMRRQEIAMLLPAEASRIVLVYQHAYRKDDYAAATLKQIAADDCLRGCHAFAYKGGNVSMIFVSRDGARLATVRSAVHSFFSAKSDRVSPCIALGLLRKLGNPGTATYSD
jgi:hypothetical protein